ncbi:MAG: NAD kinase [Lewinellaceae bacterium]|nr:NAD kinase [Saprospiraceae bacterium]MCB9339834.1 NAD kinase [Lewinellaceae bacterium]
MQVVVYSQYLKPGDLPHVQHLFDALHEFGIAAYVNKTYLATIREAVNLKTNVGEFEGYMDFRVRPFDFVITLGGDGTILAAATFVRDTGVPILGINLGRLGFLATVNKNRIRDAIGQLVKGSYSLESRSTLRLESEPNVFGETSFALNDFTILKRDTSSMITINAFVNGAYLNTYWADGLILATPTGSTGYSLSCGGPIVFPDSTNFVLTPVAPHNLNVRPLIIDDASVIAFEVEGRAENFLCTLDSRFEVITSDYQLAVRRGDFFINMVNLKDVGFLDTIRNKLTWGIDQRNH